MEKTVQMSGFISYAASYLLWVKLFDKMSGEQGSIAVRGTVHLVKFIGKGCSISFLSAYVTLLSTTGYKVLKYSSRIHMVYLAAQQKNKLSIQFPVCANIGVLSTLDILSQACEKHIQTPFSL